MSQLQATRLTDWYTWAMPPHTWCVAHADVPGLQWRSDGSQITAVLVHRSHFPLVPAEFRNLLVETATFLSRGAAPNNVTLRPYQQEALPFLLSRRGLLLAFQMRLGKTALAAHAHDPRDGTIVILGPLASRDVWLDWIERVHGFRPIALAGTQNVHETKVPHGHPGYFVHYDILEPWTEFLVHERIATLVLDECHLLQNTRSKRYSATSALCARTDRILGLTGTPMWSKPYSLYAILHLIAPGAWGNAHNFGRRYCAGMPSAHGWAYKGSSNEDELRERLGQVMLRRTWQDVAPQLPPTTTVVEPVRITGTQLAQIERAAIACTLANNPTKVTTAGYLATLRRKLADVKIPAACDAVETGMQNGHPRIVLWSWHKDVADKLAAGLEARKITVFRYRTGGDTDQIEAFRAAPTGVMVASIAAGGTAIDLSVSDYAIFAELDWIPANNQQAAMRTFSPVRPHCLVFLYVDTSIESRLLTVLQVKEDFANALGLGFLDVARLVLERV